jgi:hypothetical protein
MCTLICGDAYEVAPTLQAMEGFDPELPERPHAVATQEEAATWLYESQRTDAEQLSA